MKAGRDGSECENILIVVAECAEPNAATPGRYGRTDRRNALACISDHAHRPGFPYVRTHVESGQREWHSHVTELSYGHSGRGRDRLRQLRLRLGFQFELPGAG